MSELQYRDSTSKGLFDVISSGIHDAFKVARSSVSEMVKLGRNGPLGDRMLYYLHVLLHSHIFIYR